MSDISSPYSTIHNVGKSSSPPPYIPKAKYHVRQDGDRYAVYLGERCVRYGFVNRFTAKAWADGYNRTINDPTSLGED